MCTAHRCAGQWVRRGEEKHVSWFGCVTRKKSNSGAQECLSMVCKVGSVYGEHSALMQQVECYMCECENVCGKDVCV